MKDRRPDRHEADDPTSSLGSRRVNTGEPVPGERVGPYEVLRFVARGGMATVLAVRDVRDGSECAMKCLLPLANQEEAK